MRWRETGGPDGKMAAGQGAGVGAGAGDVVIDRRPRVAGRAWLRTGQAAVLLSGRVRGGGRETLVVAVGVGVREGDAAPGWPAVDMEAVLIAGGSLVAVLTWIATTGPPLVLARGGRLGSRLMWDALQTLVPFLVPKVGEYTMKVLGR